MGRRQGALVDPLSAPCCRSRVPRTVCRLLRVLGGISSGYATNCHCSYGAVTPCCCVCIQCCSSLKVSLSGDEFYRLRLVCGGGEGACGGGEPGCCRPGLSSSSQGHCLQGYPGKRAGQRQLYRWYRRYSYKHASFHCTENFLGLKISRIPWKYLASLVHGAIVEGCRCLAKLWACLSADWNAVRVNVVECSTCSRKANTGVGVHSMSVYMRWQLSVMFSWQRGMLLPLYTIYVLPSRVCVCVCVFTQMVEWGLRTLLRRETETGDNNTSLL